ncbi:MAG TPA: DMT family transporter [Stellaceae bacterium]|nr:DMT family transporter [Stellaceae bacterium]
MTDHTAPTSPNTVPRGIASMLLAVAIFSCMDALIKWLSATYPTIEIVFFRSAFAFLPLLPALLSGGRAALRTRRPLTQAGRAALGLVSMFAFFYCFRMMPLADVFGIAFSAPIFVTALSVPMLGERVGIRRWSAVFVGFIGVLIMLRPDAGVFASASWIALFATVLYALGQIFVRDLTKTETTTCIVFYVTLTTTAVSAAAMPVVWVMPSPVDALLLAAVGILGGMAQLAFTRAFRLAPAAVVSPFDYTGLLYAGVIGYYVWGDVPTVTFLVGAAIVMVSGLYILYRETTLARLRSA